MAFLITEDCIMCQVCEEQCPNMAISQNGDGYDIDPYLCTECVGHSGTPQCIEGCPIGAILPHPDFRETQRELEEKFILITDLLAVSA